jgi:hypothetical protein
MGYERIKADLLDVVDDGACVSGKLTDADRLTVIS